MLRGIAASRGKWANHAAAKRQPRHVACGSVPAQLSAALASILQVPITPLLVSLGAAAVPDGPLTGLLHPHAAVLLTAGHSDDQSTPGDWVLLGRTADMPPGQFAPLTALGSTKEVASSGVIITLGPAQLQALAAAVSQQQQQVSHVLGRRGYDLLPHLGRSAAIDVRLTQAEVDKVCVRMWAEYEAGSRGKGGLYAVDWAPSRCPHSTAQCSGCAALRELAVCSA
jgi:hypothetical protein